MTHFNHSPTHIHCNTIKQTSKYLRESKRHLKDIKCEATKHREVHLNQLADEEYILRIIKHARYLRSQVALHRKIQSSKKVNDKSGLKEIAIPKDKL